jgi:hypothetical protein
VVIKIGDQLTGAVKVAGAGSRQGAACGDAALKKRSQAN